MYSLNANLSMASQALGADVGAIAITNNNISNVNTPGYSREVVALSSTSTGQSGSVQDNGVSFGGFTSVRDQVLQIGINGKTSDSSSLGAQNASWSGIQTAVSSTGNDLGTALSNFFSNLSGLSTTPDDAATRQTVLSSASQLVGAFHEAASAMTTAQSDANSSIAGTVNQINSLCSQIAGLDQQLTALQGSGQDGGAVQDQRDSLTTQLAQLVGISSTNTNATPTLTTRDGSPLVMDGKAYPLEVEQDPSGVAQVLNFQGANISANLTGGSLGGALVMRDQSVPELMNALDQLAGQFASAMNTANSMGYDANGNPGTPIFGLPSAGSGAAAGISLAVTDSSSIAVSSDGAAGSSGNLSNLLAVQSQKLPSGQTPSDTYAALTEMIGSASATVNSSLTATNAALTQLQTQQGATSGVSIDEETTNLLRYQQAYSAAAKVISTVNDLFSVLMNMTAVTS